MEAQGDKLVNEAIKRILLDIVIRGHGDRLIGRWSREPELQRFLEEVPYLLDRINQLHLACTRTEPLDTRHLHHHHQHHHNHHKLDQDGGQQSSVNDFINLVGTDMHWLVRTRDTMGLTPLHKAVVHCNRPVVEFILDRYQGELAACVWRTKPQQQNQADLQQQSPGSVRLIDAQDKYGRSPLHYAAALLSDTKRHGSNPHQGSTSHIYQFLIEKGASLTVRDFRGKTPPFYVRHPNQLRSKSIIHLANKLNSNYQANVLSKTIRASSRTAPISEQALMGGSGGGGEFASRRRLVDFEQLVAEMPEDNRESMSVSCQDLRDELDRKQENVEEQEGAELGHQQHPSEPQNCSLQANFLGKRSKSSLGNFRTDERDVNLAFSPGKAHNEADGESKNNPKLVDHFHEPPGADINAGYQSPDSLVSSDQVSDDANNGTLKWLAGERCPRQILDQRTKQRLKRCLSEGVVDRITELLLEGHGSYIVCEATTACWNQQCKRYIYNVIPDLLARLDTLHELIATNQFSAMKMLLSEEPILARIRRPYKRAAINALHLAVQLNRRTMVKFLLGRHPELVTQLDSHGATCLHWAAKSLTLEQIYFWLSGQFGQQLEHIRDSRDKLASDYRQQAIRMSRGGAGGQLVDRVGIHSAPELLRQNQEASNELQLVGKRCTLTNRRRRPSKVVSNNQGSSAIGSNTGGSETLDKSIEIGLDELSSADGAEEEEEPSSDPFGPMRDDGSGHGSSVAQSVDGKNEAPRNIAQNPAEINDSDAAAREHRELNVGLKLNQPPGKNGHDTRVQNKLSSSIGVQVEQQVQPTKPEEDNSLSQKLLSEMVQLESEDFIREDDRVISPVTGCGPTKLPRADVIEDVGVAIENHQTTGEAKSRPNASLRPTSATKLDTMILDSIKANDFKKLEHLILAGCGQRLIDVFGKHFKGHSSVAISQEMQSFFETQVPNFTETARGIHEVLHRCYAFACSDSVDLNSPFHKLCSLLTRTSLIMCRDSFGATPLHVALVRSDRRLVDYWLRRHPEVASAPDRQNRTAVHYASLAFSAFKHHGRIKLTNGSAARQPPNTNIGYWVVDETSGEIYENLCSRFRELLECRDKQALTSSDYLELAARRHNQPAAANGSSSFCSPVDKLEECCPEYANLLARYEYMIVRQDPVEVAPIEPAREEVTMESVMTSGTESSRQRSGRSGSCDTGETRRPSKKGRSSGSSAQRSHTADELLKHLDGELLVPASFVPLDAAIVRQVAPKPTVGCSTGFHQMPMSPTNLEAKLDSVAGSSGELRSSKRSPVSRSPQQQQQQQQQPGGNHSGHHHHRHKARALLDDLDPNQQPSPSRHHHHHRHHHRRRHHHPKGRVSPNATHQSVVGGVIVPTIIHNDKMDEIETYDIIYRAPPSPNSRVSSSASSFSTESSSSSEGDEHRGHRKDSIRLGGGSKKAAHLKELTRAESSDSASDSIDLENEPDDYDDRVERLSTEFESRVRREKSELRAKVDQIMNEIKMSSRSDKTSRLLASPNDPAPNGTNSKKKDEASSQQQQQQPAANSGSVVNSVIIKRQGPGDTKSPAGSQSLSSSGHSSARTASSSASSVTSNCTFSSSSGSHKTSFSSSSRSTLSSSGATKHKPPPSPPATNGTKPTVDPKKQQGTIVGPKLNGQKSPHQSMGDQVSQVFSKNAYGQTYLHFIASRSQSPSVLYKVLAHGNHLIGERDIFYRTARDVAVQFNLPNNVQILDKFIIDLFIEAKTSLLRHLLNQGYSPLIHVSDPDGNDIMLILKLLKLDRMIHFLLQMADFQRWRDELHTFIRHGYSAGVSELIKKHADLVRAKSVHSRSSLHLAVLFDRAEMVNELIDMDQSSVHATDNMGRTALHYLYGLSLNNMDEIRGKLMASGASLEARDAKMRTPKYYYIFKREIEDIKRIELELN